MKRAVLLMNERAGSVQGESPQAHLEQLTQQGRKAGLDLRGRLISHGGLDAAIEEILNEKVDVLISAGGDGTISTVAAKLVDHATALGILPLGTFNHFSKDLRIPAEPEAAFRLIAETDARAIDVGDVNGHIFINNSSIGGYPEAVRQREELRQRSGLRKWSAMLVASARVFRRYPLLEVKLSLDGVASSCRTPFVFVGNNEYKMTFFTESSRDCLDRGQLAVYTARSEGRLGFLRLLWLFLINRLEQDKDFEKNLVAELWVRTHHKKVRVANDGELLHLTCPLHYRIRPGALRVIAPARV